MTTALDRTLKRLIAIDGIEYTVVLDPDGVRLVGKGKRKPEVDLRWREVLSGEAGLAAALNASLARKTATPVSNEGSATQATPATARPTAKPARRSAKARSK